MRRVTIPPEDRVAVLGDGVFTRKSSQISPAVARKLESRGLRVCRSGRPPVPVKKKRRRAHREGVPPWAIDKLIRLCFLDTPRNRRLAFSVAFILG